ncbi:MAG: 6-phosphofructokinase, partial [Gammaproteobacteria bacterium]
AVSEGIHDASGNLIVSSGAADAFGNHQLSGSGALGDILSARVKQALGAGARVRADTFGYLQRSYFGVVSEVDAREAREVGRAAVEAATGGEVPHGSMVILRDADAPGYQARFEVTELANVARHTRPLDEMYIDGDDDISASFIDYALPLVGELPRPGCLAEHPVRKLLSGPNAR